MEFLSYTSHFVLIFQTAIATLSPTLNSDRRPPGKSDFGSVIGKTASNFEIAAPVTSVDGVSQTSVDSFGTPARKKQT
jgi:hypothetical protein